MLQSASKTDYFTIKIRLSLDSLISNKYNNNHIDNPERIRLKIRGVLTCLSYCITTNDDNNF